MNLNHLVMFRALAEHGSFTAAAASISADKAQVSRVVRSLEHALGVVLVTRSTRKVTLTPAGEGLLALIRGPLDVLERAGATIADRARAPSGLVTLTTTPDLARVLVAPLLPSFRVRYPEVTVHLRVTDQVESFADPAIDLALRAGGLGGPDVRLRKVGDLQAGFFASPRYLAARGTPQHPEDLSVHETVWPHGARRASFGGSQDNPAPSVACDDFAVVLEVARAGGGVAVLPLHLARAAVGEGALVRLFPAVELAGAPLYLVSRVERPLPARVQVFRDHLAAQLSGLFPRAAGPDTGAAEPHDPPPPTG